MNAVSSAVTGGTRKTTSKYQCPRCTGSVSRIKRRTLDLLISNFSPVYRFRCHCYDCGWEGRLPAKHL